MCLDPRPERLVRLNRPAIRPSGRPALAHAAGWVPPPPPVAAPVVRASAYLALDALAGDDELVARGWVVLSRDN